ncbi:response regulator [Nodularia harveyana UHCC-0300]|uniref:histidine kinase n=1 Tax=Nodularia harveyana UHCC-0300 TaxID=2974287 RepID=A0ABU5UB52_9CYAN|nr:response regulator [Nodularia harveyana]MEA5580176.1 response regulator [Nodularia harveyana UHCC-0300]
MMNSKILIVEDEAIVAKDLRNRLKKFGYVVPAVAHSGEEAIKKALEFCPDLILMDISLKGKMDGIEAAYEIHKYLDIPIIYLTAYADDQTLTRAKITDHFGYLLKPFKERELQINIEISLNQYQLKKQLTTNQKWLSTLLNSISDGVISSDLQQFVTFMNPVAESLIGWKQEEACGRHLSEVFNIAHAVTHEPVKLEMTKVLQDGVIVNLPVETVLLAKNGAEIPIDNSFAPIKDDQDQIIGSVLVFRDVTEREQVIKARQKEVEQEQLLVQLSEINRLKNEFLSLFSHELRSPLTNMKVIIKMLQTSFVSPDNQRYLAMLSEECDREMRLINDLLDLQKLETQGSVAINTDVLVLEQFIPWVISPFKVRAQENEQTLQLNLPSNLPTLLSDPTSLERILGELIHNACKYTPSGGDIILSIDHNSAEIPPKTVITLRNSVEIPTEKLPRIFDKFYRLPNADIRNQGGTGLGLSIVQKLVEQLQGIIEVESSAGWTTFRVILHDLVISSS